MRFENRRPIIPPKAMAVTPARDDRVKPSPRLKLSMPAAVMTWGMAPAQQPTAAPKAAKTIMTAARGVRRFIICVGRID